MRYLNTTSAVGRVTDWKTTANVRTKMDSNEMSLAEYITVHPLDYEHIVMARQGGLISWDTTLFLLKKVEAQNA